MSKPTQQIRLAAIVFTAVVAVLAVIYFVLLRQEMMPVFQNIRASDASEIVAELDGAGIPYELANDGRDILVPEDQAAEARVVVAGANISFGGTVGFELFNDSDMGLTEFAQKINFQRAMQGELARTIMMMDGVAFARVHLALPERSIFRAAQGQPTAAVTIEMLPSAHLSPRRIEGVRQLVASAVPGLPAYAVAILDEQGDLVSGVVGAIDTAGEPTTERDALEQFYATRGRAAIRAALPQLAFELTVSATPVSPDLEMPSEDGPVTERREPRRDELHLRAAVRTPTALDETDRERIEMALAEDLSLERERGDALIFSTGAVSAALPYAAQASPQTETAPFPAEPEWSWREMGAEYGLGPWLVLVAVLVLLIGFAALRPRGRLAPTEAEDFARLLLDGASANRERSDA